jgi:hypothetical protein
MASMRQLTLGDLKLGLTDLLGKRRPALELTPVGQRYAPMLQAKLDRIAALPRRCSAARPSRLNWT